MTAKHTEAFRIMPQGSETVMDLPEIDYHFDSSINLVDKRDVNQSVVMMGHIGGLRENPDYAKLQVMNRILSGGFAGRLMRIIRSQMGLDYTVFGQYSSNNVYPGVFSAEVIIDSETCGGAV